MAAAAAWTPLGGGAARSEGAAALGPVARAAVVVQQLAEDAEARLLDAAVQAHLLRVSVAAATGTAAIGIAATATAATAAAAASPAASRTDFLSRATEAFGRVSAATARLPRAPALSSSSDGGASAAALASWVGGRAAEAQRACAAATTPSALELLESVAAS
jgi:hypothetical protein